MFAADVNQVNMEMDLIKILALSNLLTAAFDIQSAFTNQWLSKEDNRRRNCRAS